MKNDMCVSCSTLGSGVFDFFLSLSTLSCLSFAWHMCSQILFSFHDSRMFLQGLMALESCMRQQLTLKTHGISSRSLEET